MRISLGLLVVAAGLIMTAVAAGGEFRRIEEIEATGRGGRLMLEDWDGDGKLQLIRGDAIDEPGTGMAGRYLYLTTIYDAGPMGWEASQSFVHHYGQVYKGPPGRLDRDTVHRLSGDFNADGIPDELVATSPASLVPKDTEDAFGTLYLEQNGHRLYEDDQYRLHSILDSIFNRFQSADLDGDGNSEVIVWILGYQENDRIIIYGDKHSRWQDSNTFDVPWDLTEAMQFVRGVRAAHPETPCPVTVTLETLDDDEFPDFEHPRSPGILRVRVQIEPADEGSETNMAAWRAYIKRWATAYTRESGAGTYPIHTAWGLNFEEREGALLASIGLRTYKNGGFHTPRYDADADHAYVWVECAFLGADARPLGWTGTLRSSSRWVSIPQKSE